MARKNDSSQMSDCMKQGISNETVFSREREIKCSNTSARQDFISFEEENGTLGWRPSMQLSAGNQEQESGKNSDKTPPPFASQRSIDGIIDGIIDGKVSGSRRSGIMDEDEKSNRAENKNLSSEKVYTDLGRTFRGKAEGWDVELTKEDSEQSPHAYYHERRQPDSDIWPPCNKEKVIYGNSGGSGTCILGEDIQYLKKSDPNRRLPVLKASAEHTVLVEVSTVKRGTIPSPFQGYRADVWDRDHVKMPYSSHNTYEATWSSMKPRWEIITKALRKKLSTPHDIEKAIKSYNKKYEKQWKFNGLNSFFASLQDGLRDYYLQSVIPKMSDLALQLPKICPKPIPLLKKGHQHTITMSQQQAACLLANAFFCTFPRRNATENNSEFSTYPSINFNRLFDEETSSKRQKLRAIFCYFDQIFQRMRSGLVTFERRSLFRQDMDWSKCKAGFTKLHMACTGNIEENGEGMLQVDFASPIVGGGVLSAGLVQEEIRFLINTELIVSRLFTEKLEAKESLIITGAEQYSRYDGYSRHFEWREAMTDKTPRDAWKRRCIEIVAIDAIQFRDPQKQFTRECMERELNKAYSGFQVNHCLQENTAIATGNWGCGAFNGCPKMKALLQLMAAAEARRDVAYFTFGDRNLMNELHDMHLFLSGNFITVGQLHTCLKNYCRDNRWESRSVYNDLKLKLTKMAKI